MSNTTNEYTQTDLGNVSPNPKGDYSDAVSYEYLDLVHLDGGSYLCTAELGTTIIGVAPTPGKTTKEWQCVAIPGDITPDYIRLHDEVMKAAEQVGKDASNVAQDKRDVTDMVKSAAVLLTQTQEAAKEADQSKAQAAGYANSAKSSAQTAAAAEESVTKQVTGFDTYVLAAKEAIGQARQDAVGVVSSQGDTSVKEVQAAQSKAQEAIEQDKTAALQDIESTKAAVVGAVEGAGTEATQEIAQEKKEALEAVTTAQASAVKAVTDVQSTAVGAVQTAQTTATKAVQDAQTEATDAVEKAKQEALEAIGSNETVMQVERNTEDIADIQGELTALGPAIILSASGPDITVTDSAKRPFVQDKIFGETVQRTTTGAQLIPLLPENLVASDGLTGVINSDGTLTVTGTPVQQYSAVFRKEISLTPGNYYISGGETAPGKVRAQIVITRSDDSIKGVNNSSFEAKADDKKYVITIQTNDLNIQAVNQTLSPMLNKGSSPLPWEPYTGGIASPSMDYPQELDTVGAEKDQIVQEVTGRNLFDVSTSLKGFISLENGLLVSNSEVSRSSDFIPVIANYNYTLSYKFTGEVSVRAIAFYNASRTFISSTTYLGNGNINKQFIVPQNVAYVRFTYIVGAEEIVLNEGSTALPWEPYQSPQQLIIPVDGGLPGIPVKTGGNYTDKDGQQWIANYVDLERGKLIKLVDKEVISGTPNFTESSDTPGRFIYNALQTARYKTGVADCLSNFAHWIHYGIPTNNKWVFAVSGNALYVSPPKDSGITAENLNTMFAEMIAASDTPPVIIGQLKTPEEIDLDPEIITAYKALHSNYPSTVVSNQDGAWQEIEYAADTGHYIDQNFVPKESYTQLEKRVTALEQATVNTLPA
ncbi:MAG TPA: hypothetical protein H9740_09720 [Candidatus Hungatella pullicola]|nr:hypothetical protein [Candidatus Hungatella pullicola]